MKGVLLTMAITVAAVYAVLLAFMFVAQDSLVYYPGIAREIAATPAAHGLPYEDLTITTADGEKLNAWWVPAETPRGAVLLLHGNAGNISHRIDYARMFRSFGYSTLLVDYRGYGKSSGSPSEEGTYRDAEAAWAWLTSRGVREDEIVLFGESLGGAVAAWLAARHAPHALVIASCFTSVPDLGAEIYRFLPVRLLSRIHYDTRSHLARVRAPVLIAHSPDDDIIPYAHGRRLFAAANEPKAFLELGGGHNDGFIFMRPEWVSALRIFLERTPAAAPK